MNLKPDYIFDNIYNIKINELINDGMKGIIIDIDNTMLPWDSWEVDEKLLHWIDEIKSNNISICILSNGKRERIKHFSNILNVPAAYGTMKPLKKAYKSALKVLNLDKDKVCMIGDQLLTDVLGAKLMRIKSILVEPIAHKEMFLTKINRFLERIIFKRKELI